ncbi:hypothetical protein ACUNIZ_08760 [Serratia sp. IR-2025]
MSKETGGNAFPYSGVHTFQGRGGITFDDRGMSLRDYFAAKEMQGDLSFGAIVPNASDELISMFANHYYRIADAMLKARNN